MWYHRPNVKNVSINTVKVSTSFLLNIKGISFVERPCRKIIKHRWDTFCFLHLKLNNLNQRLKHFPWYMSMACFEDGHGWRTNAQKEWQGQKHMEREEGWYRNLPVHMERSHSKLAEMEAFHYINKIRTVPRAHWRCLCVRLSDQSYLLAHVFHMELPWSLQME